MVGTQSQLLEQVQWFADEGIQEAQSLEFKAGAPDNWQNLDRNHPDRTKLQGEFLKDIAGMANGGGGTLYYGVREDGNAAAKSVPGFEWRNSDNAMRGLVKMARDHISPPVNIQMDLAPLPELKDGQTRYVLAVQIPSSWGTPHMVTFQQSTQFYLRREGSVVEMNIHEIREGFARGPELSKRLDEWRTERIEHVAAGLSPTQEIDTHLVVVHVLPLRDWSIGHTRDLRPLQWSGLQPFGYRQAGYGVSWNIDGFAIQPPSKSEHVQVFRSTAVEAIVRYPTDGKTFAPAWVAGKLVSWLPAVRKFYADNAVLGPYAVSLCIEGAAGLVPQLGFSMFLEPNPLRRRSLRFPALMLDSFSEHPLDDVEALLNMLWQACDFECCPEAVMDKLRKC